MGKAIGGATGYASDAVNEERLWGRHMDMAKIGATAKGGVNREALTPEDAEARALFVTWGRELGFQCSIDDIGNIFVRRPGSDADAAPVVTGSHLDTQPNGGRFDGIFGVLAGLEALQAAEDAGIATRRPLDAVVWTNEEGSRFVPGCLGSECFVHPDRLDRLLAITDADGVVLADALAKATEKLPGIAHRPLGGEVAALVEAHIEQGPVLEDAGKTIGVVTGITGARRYVVDVRGENAHSGTTTRKRRKDAFVAAVAMINALHRVFHDPEDKVRFTIGRFAVEPNSPYVVPGRVSFTIDFRQPGADILERLGGQVETICQENSGPCAVTVEEINRVTPKKFDGLVPDTILSITRCLGYPHMHIFSGAGHDAQNFAAYCPTGMIFVPCEGGVSHSEVENATPSDLAAGARVLADVMVEIANR